MYLDEAQWLYEYWADHLPTHELAAIYMGIKPEETVAEQHAKGAMNDAEFFEHFKRTGGRVADVAKLGS